jgi:hypothetical protein
MAVESRKQALQAALAKLLIATASELNDRKHHGWAYCVYNKTDPSSLSTLHALVGGDDISHDDYNQFLVDAGLLKKPQRAAFAHGVGEDIWEAFCGSYNIKYCEPRVMNASKIKIWEGGKKESVFLRLGGAVGIDPKEQMKQEATIKAPKLRSTRFQDARMTLKKTIDKKAADVEVPTSKGGSKKLPSEDTTSKLQNDASYILSWEKTTGAVLLRIGGATEDKDEWMHAGEQGASPYSLYRQD